MSRVEPVLVLAAAPLLLFPRGLLPWVGLGLIALGWALRGLATGRWLVRTPLDRPIAILLVMTFVGLYVSVDRTLSLPKLYGILLGFAVYYVTVAQVTSARPPKVVEVDGAREPLEVSTPGRGPAEAFTPGQEPASGAPASTLPSPIGKGAGGLSSTPFYLAVAVLIAGLIAVLGTGLVGTEWSLTKYPLLKPVYSMLPKLIHGMRASGASVPGFNPNELGGSLAFLLPLPLGIFLGAPLRWWSRVGLGIVVLLGLGLLVLSASRSGAAALGVAVLILLIWRWRRAGLALLAVLAIGLGVIFVRNQNGVIRFLLTVDVANPAWNEVTLSGRTEIWERARYAIEDFPYTGVGLNTFPVVVDNLYPFFTIFSESPITHAHNIFLQTAIDLGLGGLLGFVGLCALVAQAGWRAYRRLGGDARFGRPAQAAIVGLLAGLLAYLVFGITDAITLGAKPSVLLWVMAGLVVSAGGQESGARRRGTRDGDRETEDGDRESGSERRWLANDPHALIPNPHPSSPIPHPLIPKRSTAVVRFILGVVWEMYWMIAYFLVAMGLLVVAVRVSGWVP